MLFNPDPAKQVQEVFPKKVIPSIHLSFNSFKIEQSKNEKRLGLNLDQIIISAPSWSHSQTAPCFTSNIPTEYLQIFQKTSFRLQRYDL